MDAVHGVGVNIDRNPCSATYTADGDQPVEIETYIVCSVQKKVENLCGSATRAEEVG
jgi:hypothetical protein